MCKYYSEPTIELRHYRINQDVFTDSTNDPDLFNNDDDEPTDDGDGNNSNGSNFFAD